MEYIQKKYILKPLKVWWLLQNRSNFSEVKLESIKIVKICIVNKLDFNFLLHFFFSLTSRWFETQLKLKLSFWTFINQLWICEELL
jgi:hypothetical protein